MPHVLPFTATTKPLKHAPGRARPRALSPTLSAIVDDLEILERAKPDTLVPLARIARQFARGFDKPEPSQS